LTPREATAKNRKANAHRLEDVQAFQRIFAPFGGVITRRNAEVGILLWAHQRCPNPSASAIALQQFDGS
jgi:hypothetical protein